MKEIFLLLFFLSGLQAWGKLLQDEQNNVDVYQKCNPSVVNITAITLKYDWFFEIYPQKGVGSGAIIRPDGYIATNDHVIGSAVDVHVTLHDKSSYTAKVIGRDPELDVTVIKINAGSKKLAALEYGNVDLLSVGQKTLAIGNPFGLGGSLSVGVVSSLGRDVRSAPNRPVIKEMIQTDAAVNPGNSGGPLLDSSGKMIGLNTQILSTSGGSEGVGFAISVKTIRKIVNELIQFGKVLRPWLGLEGVGMSQDLLRTLRVPLKHGMMITGIYANSPAAKSGLEAANKALVFGFKEIPYGGDIIYQIDNTEVTSHRDILDYIFEKKVGDTVVLHLMRGQTKRSLTVKLSLPSTLKSQSL
ncbi:MAG: trypsin-like peptidase domain-containing protein [Deltaproteobacteria bacterium]|nr:trypsin-like peptidase domain-containing protein [Deltaproteobacteria bacterium]